jgi:TonB family protein
MGGCFRLALPALVRGQSRPLEENGVNPIMKRCLFGSTAVHGLIVLLLFSGLFRPAPIHLVTTYGVEYMGTLGGGGGGNCLPAPIPAPPQATEPEEAKPAAPVKSTVKSDESTWGLKKAKKNRHAKLAAPKKAAVSLKTAAAHPASVSTKTGTAAGVEGGQGEGIGIGVGSGSGPGTGTGSGGFPYSWYLISVKTKLWREWGRWAGSSQPHNCVVTFSIERDGSVERVALHQSSGDSFYDQMAVRSVNYAAPFPPLPEGYGSGDLELYVEFKFLTEQ